MWFTRIRCTLWKIRILNLALQQLVLTSFSKIVFYSVYKKLDPAHYFTLPGYAWDCMLKLTEVKLDLLTDYDMHMMIESGIRGGIYMIAHRYAKANNKYLPDYDESHESSYLTYLDANNLYGWAMVQDLPINNFKWSEERNNWYID